MLSAPPASTILVTLQAILCDNLLESSLPTQSVFMLEWGTKHLTCHVHLYARLPECRNTVMARNRVLTRASWIRSLKKVPAAHLDITYVTMLLLNHEETMSLWSQSSKHSGKWNFALFHLFSSMNNCGQYWCSSSTSNQAFVELGLHGIARKIFSDQFTKMLCTVGPRPTNLCSELHKGHTPNEGASNLHHNHGKFLQQGHVMKTGRVASTQMW